jgi:hypothetical protein
MLLRLLVALIALGVGIGVVEASALPSDIAVEPGELELAEEVEEASYAMVLISAAPLDGNRRPLAPPPSVRDPLRYQHLLFVFRPPRAAAFD